jgi:LacI family gluconate utilization system Gnt-I transcriptional repressor
MAASVYIRSGFGKQQSASMAIKGRTRARRWSSVRMEDVAERAGVSLMTVSRAIRLPHTVSERTRAKVEAARTALSYVGSALAGQLAAGRTRLVGVVLPDLRNAAFALAMQGLSDALGTEFELVVASPHGAAESDERVIRSLLGYHPVALVVHGNVRSATARDMLVQSSIPVVEMGSLPKHPVGSAVGYSNRAAGSAATEYLLSKGHRHIGFVCAPMKHNRRAKERWQGHRAALTSHGIAARPELEIETDLGYRRGEEALTLLLQRDPRLDAVFFSGDVWALGALFYCQRQGISVPGQLALMGFDDQEQAGLVAPSLTTIRVPRYEMGAKAGCMLREQLASSPARHSRVDLGFELVARESA